MAGGPGYHAMLNLADLSHSRHLNWWLWRLESLQALDWWLCRLESLQALELMIVPIGVTPGTWTDDCGHWSHSRHLNGWLCRLESLQALELMIVPIGVTPGTWTDDCGHWSHSRHLNGWLCRLESLQCRHLNLNWSHSRHCNLNAEAWDSGQTTAPTAVFVVNLIIFPLLWLQQRTW